MAIDVDGIQTFTTAELLKLVDYAIASCLINKSYTINGRSFTRENLSELRAMKKELQDQQQAEINASTGGMNALVKFGEAQ